MKQRAADDKRYINDDKPEGKTYIEHVQCRSYVRIAGINFAHDIVSFQVTFNEGSMCLFDQELFDIFKSSDDIS